MRLSLAAVLAGLFSVGVHAAVVPVAAPGAKIDFDQAIDASLLLKRARRSAARGAVSVPAAADQGVFDYKIKAYPKDAGKCPVVAKSLGEAFATMTGADVVRSLCEDASDKGYDIKISYQAAQKLNLVSTARLGSGIYDEGAYASSEECRAAVAGESARFSRATGLTPFVAYCAKADFARKEPWVLRIDAFGETEVGPHFSGTHLFGRVLGYSKERFLGEVEEGLKRLGADVSYVRIRPQIAMSELVALYYGKERLPLSVNELAKLAKREQCDEQLALARKALGGGPALLSFCSSMQVGMPFEVSFLFAGGPLPSSSAAYERYESYDECMGARSGMVDYYRNAMGKEVAGALCGRADRAWRVIILEP